MPPRKMAFVIGQVTRIEIGPPAPLFEACKPAEVPPGFYCNDNPPTTKPLREVFAEAIEDMRRLAQEEWRPRVRQAPPVPPRVFHALRGAEWLEKVGGWGWASR